MKKQRQAFYVEVCAREGYPQVNWWRIRAKNKRILATSEMYPRRCYAMRSANTVAKALGVPVNVKVEP